MKREELNTRVTAAFIYNLETLVAMLDLEHGDAQEFKSVKKAIVIGAHATHRWVDPPEKKPHLATLKATLMQYAVPELAGVAAQLCDPIIVAYYEASRGRSPVKGKIKEPIKSE